MDIEKKRQKEIEIVSLMIHLYCRYHDDIDEQELIGYAAGRIEKCPMMQKKDILQSMSYPLLSKRNAGKNKKGHAL